MADNYTDERSPEIEGTRITVYTLLPHFLDSAATEAYICELYSLRPEQVAAARAYVLNNADIVLSRHLQIEAKMADGNPPQVIESASRTQATLWKFKEWLAQQGAAASTHQSDASLLTSGRTNSEKFLTFKQWLAECESRPSEGS